jgi:hypothetical protein
VSIDLFVTRAVELLQDAGLTAAAWDVVPDVAGWSGAPGQSSYQPYVLVTRLGSADQLGFSFEDRFNDFRPDLFCRYFGASVQQADQTAAAVRAVMLGRPDAPAGFKTVRCWVYNSQTTTRSQNTEVSIFEAGDFYRWWCAPTEEESGD